MTNRDIHPSGQELLLCMDNELSLRQAKRVRSHLAVCPGCRVRLAKMKTAIDNFEQAQSQARRRDSDAAGSRALLKAQMTELAQSTIHGRWWNFRFAADIRDLAWVCALVLLVILGTRVVSLHHAAHRSHGGVYAGLLPNPDLTPGSTRQVTVADLCSPSGEETVQESPNRLQRKIFQEYGLQVLSAKNYEMDYLITPELGGSDDVRNLWPEPHFNAWNSYVKDQLEQRLHHMVCGGTLSLAQAQKDIASNWIAAYKKYFHTDQPLPMPLPSNASNDRMFPGEPRSGDVQSMRQLHTRFKWMQRLYRIRSISSS